MTNKPMLSVERDERADFEKEVQAKAERFQPDFRRYGLHPDAEYKCANNQWAWELWQKRASMDKPAAQHQVEPVALQHIAVSEGGVLRWMTGLKMQDCELYAMPDGSAIRSKLYAEQPAPVADHTQCEECKGWGYHENHHEGGGTECGECGGSGNATVAVVIPDRMKVEPFTTIDRGSKNYKAGYNAAIAEVARLNWVKP